MGGGGKGTARIATQHWKLCKEGWKTKHDSPILPTLTS
jgi:hypothetical protein